MHFLSRELWVMKEQVVGEESLMRLPTATLLHTESRGADVTDVIEESVLEVRRNV